MTAIITDKIKKQFAQQILDEFVGASAGDSDNYYYIAVGRSQQWQPETNADNAIIPTATEREERKFRYDMQSVKSAEAASFVIPLYDWSANTTYQAYNDNVEGQPSQSYYVRTEDNNVYICIRTGKNVQGGVQISTVKPSHVNTTLPIEVDGYVWKFLYTISTADANKFLTSAFMPVKFVDSADALSPDFQQYNVQNAAIAGQIVGYRVTEAGGVYSSAPTLTVVGNGSNAKARAILNATGGIAAVEVGDSANAPLLSNMGSGYDYANVVIGAGSLAGGGTVAKVVPVFAADAGLGADASTDLRTTAVMFNIKPEGTVSDKWVVDKGYRQVGILKNPTVYNSATKFSATQGIALKKMTLTNPVGDGDPTNGYGILFNNDVKITGGSSTAKAWLDFYDDSSTIWYHQDEYTGFTPFQNTETITVEGYSASTLTLSAAMISPDIDNFSGDLLFINNFGEVQRDRAQTEDIKVVIKL